MTKQEKIQALLEMQRRFLEKEKSGALSMQEYFAPTDDSSLHGYTKDYTDLAMKIVDDAHEEVGSKR